MDLCIEHISKRFKDMTAVDDISLSLTPGGCQRRGKNHLDADACWNHAAHLRADHL